MITRHRRLGGRRHGRHLAAAALVCLPSAALAADAVGGVAASLGPWLAVVALVLLVGAVHYRRRLVRAEARATALDAELVRVRAVLGHSPQAFIFWNTATGEQIVGGAAARLTGLDGGTPAGPEKIAAALGDGADGDLVDAITAMLEKGTDFDRSLRATGKRPVTVAGRAAPGSGIAVLWIRDDSDSRTEIEAAQRVGDGFRRLLDMLPLPVWRRGRDLRLDYGNRAYREAVEAAPGTPAAELAELSAGPVASGGRALAVRAAETATEQTEVHHVVAAGARRLMSFTEVPGDADGTISGFAVDRTEIEEVQAELSRHLQSHDEVLHHLGTAIAIFGADHRLAFHNTAYVKLWELEEAFLDSRPTLGEVLESLRDRRRLPEYANFPEFKASQIALFTSLLQPFEELLHLPDGKTLRSVITPHPFGGLLMTWEDVTASLALERSYNTLIAVQKETLDNLYEGVAVIGGDGRLQLSNPAFGRMWQLGEDELAAAPHISQIVDRMRPFLYAEGDWDDQRERLIGLLTDRQGNSGRIERADEAVLDFATVPLPDGATLLSYLDVSDSHRVEQFLRERNEALETADRLKSEFIANVSYELRTPLNTIIGFAEILDGAYFGTLNERQGEYSRGILESSQRLLSLINDILDLATIESGHMSLELDSIDLHDLLTSVLGLTRERVTRKNLRLDFDCPPEIGTIVADERRLKQALFNILSNSVKFTPESGEITVSARRVEDHVIITFTDTGIGIPEEDHDRIFGRFERGKSPEARRSGAGLGLSLVKSFIDLHGGTVELESEPGVGTKVVCRLPARKPSEDRKALAGNA